MTKVSASAAAKAKAKEAITYGGITPAQVAGWKKQYGDDDIRVIEVDLDKEGKRQVHCYARKPDFDILSAASAMAHQPLKSAEVLYQNCYLGGDPETIDNKEVKHAVMLQMSRLFEVKTARIKNA